MVEGFSYDVSGLYSKQNNNIYQHENATTNSCIWWHEEYRHWWIGNCNSISENQGHAWLVPDRKCPDQGKRGEWRRGGSDEPIESGLVREAKATEKTVDLSIDEGSNPHPSLRGL